MERHFPLSRLATALRADGVTVDMLVGAQGRSARRFTTGFYMGCQASCAHHTGSSGMNPGDANSGDIGYILKGQGDGIVIANAYTARDGRVTLIASGPTYTEGLGGPRGLIPKNRGNDVTFSNEIGGGVGAPFPTAQQRSVKLLHRHVNAIAADVWDWPDDPWGPDRLFAHFEWAPGRKVDPKGESEWATGYTMWNMDAFRQDARPPAATGWQKGEAMGLHTRNPKHRLVDTRVGFGAPKARVKAGEELRVGIPASPTGDAAHTAIVNVTVVGPTAVGHLQVDGTIGGGASDGNFAPGTVPLPVSTISAVAEDGTIGIGLHGGDAHIIVDLMGVVT